MMKQLPGLTIEGNNLECRKIFNSMYSTGGLVLSQICTVTGLETHTVQNWVKRGYVSPPIEKKYSMDKLARLATINAVKDCLPIDNICSLISHINGDLVSESDDLISDSDLYFYFVDLLFRYNEKREDLVYILDDILSNYIEPVYGAKDRLKVVLEILLISHLSCECKRQALLLMKISRII